MNKIYILAALLLGLSACGGGNNSDLTADQINKVLQVYTNNDTKQLPADGFSTATIYAVIAPNATKRTLKFTASSGELIGGTTVDGSKVKTVSADSSGIAALDLRSSREIVTAYVSVQSAEDDRVRRDISIDFTAADPDTVVKFESVPVELPSDGATQGVVTVRVNPALTGSNRQVTFKASSGAFASSPEQVVTPDSSNIATVDYRAPRTVGMARITAIVNGFSQQATIGLHAALPERILLESSNDVKSGEASSARISVTLLRAVGLVNDNLFAQFNAATSAGNPIGTFRNHSASVATGTSQSTLHADFFPGVTTYRGPVTLKVSVPGSSAEGQSQIQVVSQ